MARVSTGLLSLLAVTLLAATAGAQHCCPWNRPMTEESQPDVFFNFYQPGNGGNPAGALPAPSIALGVKFPGGAENSGSGW